MTSVPQLLPIFPLDSVLLPGAPLPLHIFEPRYRELVADVWLEHGRDNERAGFGIVALAHPRNRRRGPRPGSPAPRTRPPLITRSATRLKTSTRRRRTWPRVGTFASIIEVEAL